MPSSNRVVLEAVAQRIKPLLSQVVFVGGQVAELLITDPAAVRIRPTDDVDVVVTAATRLEYRKIEDQVRALGFSNDLREGAPICRWISPDGHMLDLMPVDESVLGFSNRWYSHAVTRTADYELREGLCIRLPTPPVFVATKLEAFRGRGNEDLLGSHDLEDVISVVAGRPGLVEEASLESVELREWLQRFVRGLLEHPEFPYAVQG
ncbi:MAG: hypothetical protein ACC652_15085, partial [Acidimicrobiales bacterium]